MWFETSEGLSKFNTKNNSFINITKNDELPFKEFNFSACLLSKSGKVYFGGSKGFISFFSDSLKENKKVSNIVFTNFYIFNKLVVIGAKNSSLKKHINESDKIILSYKQSVFTIKICCIELYKF